MPGTIGRQRLIFRSVGAAFEVTQGGFHLSNASADCSIFAAFNRVAEILRPKRPPWTYCFKPRDGFLDSPNLSIEIFDKFEGRFVTQAFRSLDKQLQA